MQNTCFPVNFVKFSRKLFFTDHFWWGCFWKFERCLCSTNVSPATKILSAVALGFSVTLLKRESSDGIFCEFCEILKSISFTENHRATASGNDPRQSLVFWGKSLRNGSFLIRRRLYFNSSYIFAKRSTKSHCFTQSDCYLVG